eukprot:6206577-Pleurochrysis_carterae.AAC.1
MRLTSLANLFSIIPSSDLKQRRKFNAFTRPPIAPSQAVNHLRFTANAHMQEVQRSVQASLPYSSFYPLYSAHPFIPSASSHTDACACSSCCHRLSLWERETDRSWSQAAEGVDSSQRHVVGDGLLSEPGGKVCGSISAPGRDGPLKEPWERGVPRVQRSVPWRKNRCRSCGQRIR